MALFTPTGNLDGVPDIPSYCSCLGQEPVYRRPLYLFVYVCVCLYHSTLSNKSSTAIVMWLNMSTRLLWSKQYCAFRTPEGVILWMKHHLHKVFFTEGSSPLSEQSAVFGESSTPGSVLFLYHIHPPHLGIVHHRALASIKLCCFSMPASSSWLHGPGPDFLGLITELSLNTSLENCHLTQTSFQFESMMSIHLVAHHCGWAVYSVCGNIEFTLFQAGAH